MNAKQKRTKIQFWRKVSDNPLVEPKNLSNAEIAEIAQEPQLKLWLANEEFRAWFMDDKALEDLLQLGAESAVERLISIVNETNVGPREAVSSSSQVAAAKILLDFAGLAPAKKTETTIKADQLPNDEAELRKYIEANAKKLKVLDGK